MKVRAFVIGMHARNHAWLKEQFSVWLDLHFYDGNQRTLSEKFREGDHVFIAVDFANRTMRDRVMDDLKRLGLKKSQAKMIKGGMSAMARELQEVVAQQDE